MVVVWGSGHSTINCMDETNNCMDETKKPSPFTEQEERLEYESWLEEVRALDGEYFEMYQEIIPFFRATLKTALKKSR